MDRILVINAGSSSVKFQLFALDGAAQLTRKIKGQVDGIGTRAAVSRNWPQSHDPHRPRRSTRHGFAKTLR
jgi:acetate kinase